FARGDTVAIDGPDGTEVARGLAAYDAADAIRIAGLKTHEIPNILGYQERSAMVHRDDLVLSPGIKATNYGTAEEENHAEDA
ncbi:MAG TPA: PUA domain-containing protein, partial [Sphingomonadales bacterium]